MNKGYASEACVLIEEYAKNYLNLRKIKLFVVTSNVAAVRLWEKLRYKKIGEYEEDRYIEGVYRNVSIMEKFITDESC